MDPSGLVRFIGSEDGYLSLTNDGPRMYINIEDYFTHSSRFEQNPKFQKAVAIMRSPRCRPAF
jgi:hypothetical protein